MASIEFLIKRIEGKEKEVDKLQKKLKRIYKAKESNWENNPYYYNERDIKYTERDLNNAMSKLVEYKEKLAIEEEKANSRNVKPILDFLEIWKERVRDYYLNSFMNYIDAIKEYNEKNKEYRDWYNYERMKYSKEERKEKESKYRKYKREFNDKWNFLEEYVYWSNNQYNFNMSQFDKDINREAEMKYDDIIERTNKIVGKITDATCLRIGAKGDLNGIIVGEKGTASVNTIGAGGYNIQCFHFRTLIKEYKIGA